MRGDGNIGDISSTRERFENENSKTSDQEKDSTLKREDKKLFKKTEDDNKENH